MSLINILGNTLTGQSGTGAFLGNHSPSMTTPSLDVITATSLNLGGSSLNKYTSLTLTTPTLTFATPGDLSVSYATQVCLATRIGSIIYFNITLICTPTYTTASGAINIVHSLTGPTHFLTFPVSINSSYPTLPASTLVYVGFFTTGIVQLYGQKSGNLTALGAANLPTGNQVNITVRGSYVTAL